MYLDVNPLLPCQFVQTNEAVKAAESIVLDADDPVKVSPQKCRLDVVLRKIDHFRRFVVIANILTLFAQFTKRSFLDEF